jgi:L-threonylcarbamoyladenylate synthase
MPKQAVVLSLRSDNLGECAARVAISLKQGNLCIVPTDTIYGIVALDRLPDAVERVYAIKKRPLEKSLIRLIGRVESLRDFTDQALPPSLATYWPGPLTIVFEGKRRGTEPAGTTAVRFPNDPFLRRLFEELCFLPLVAPSANISGEEDIFDCSVLAGMFSSAVDVILCREKWSGGKKASTIVDISGKPWKILREGAVKVDPSAFR